RLAYRGRRVVRERDAERATFARVELVHATRHAVRHHPRRDRMPIEQRAVHGLARCLDAATDARRGHSRHPIIHAHPSPLGTVSLPLLLMVWVLAQWSD